MPGRSVFAAVRRQGGSLPLIVLGAVVLAAVTGLSATVPAFALARPQFAQAWNDKLAAEQAEDSNFPHPEAVLLSALGALPALLLSAGLVGAVLQAACTVCVTAAQEHPSMGARRLWSRTLPRVPSVAAVCVLRGVLVLSAALASGALCVGLGLAVDTFTGVDPFSTDGPFTPIGIALMLAPSAVLLRAGFLLAPAACAVDGLAPRAALRRSWSLMGQRAAVPWLLGACVIGAACAGAVWLLVQQVAAPLRTAAREAVLADLTHNTYVAHAAGALTPPATAALLWTVLALPPAHTYLTVAYLRLRGDAGR
ncbi:hypothetical protein [Streptomyces sp. NPDC092370]|uniref:hypothetical protein n=1 Tax=Streptomyces sp. NPDC092370 TaxID=3366016 RepID=UPI00382122D8